MDDAMSAIQDAMGSAKTSGDEAGEEASTGLQQAAEEMANAQDIANQFFGNKGDNKSKRQASLSGDTQTAQQGATHDFNTGLRGGMLDLTSAQHTAGQYLGGKDKRQTAPAPGAPAQQSPFSGFKGFFDQIFGPKGQPQQPPAAGNTQGSSDQCAKDSKMCGGGSDQTQTQAGPDKTEAEDKPKNGKPKDDSKNKDGKAQDESQTNDDKGQDESKTKDGKVQDEFKPKDGKAEAGPKTKDDKAEAKDTKSDDAKQDKEPVPDSNEAKSIEGVAATAQDHNSAEENAASISRRGVHFNKQKHQAAFKVARDLPERRRTRPSHGPSQTTYYKTKSANAFISSAMAMETQQTHDGQDWLKGIAGKYGRGIAEEHEAHEIDSANEVAPQIEKRRDQDADSYKEMTSNGAISCWNDTITRILAALIPVATLIIASLV